MRSSVIMPTTARAAAPVAVHGVPRSRPVSRPAPAEIGRRSRRGGRPDALSCSHATAPRIFEHGQACIRLLHLLGYAHKDELRGQYGDIVLPFGGTMASDNASGCVAQRLRVATARSSTRHDRLRAE